MTFRRSLTLATLALALGAASVQAGEYKGKHDYTPKPQHSYGVPVVTSNSLTANNVAAGYKNKANQSIFADQSGAPGWYGGGGTTVNSIDANNIAAGKGNVANQDIMARQGGSGGLTLNRLDAMNLAAGEHNLANQRIFSQQR